MKPICSSPSAPDAVAGAASLVRPPPTSPSQRRSSPLLRSRAGLAWTVPRPASRQGPTLSVLPPFELTLPIAKDRAVTDATSPTGGSVINRPARHNGYRGERRHRGHQSTQVNHD